MLRNHAAAITNCQVSIEPAHWRDLNSLRTLEKACFPRDAWPILDLVGVLAFPGVVRFKAVCNGQMVGFVAGDVRRWEGMAWIATLGVLPEFRGRGIAAALLKACEAAISLTIIRLCVRPSNEAAIRLYERFGYHKVGEWSNYYQDGEAALVMEKTRL